MNLQEIFLPIFDDTLSEKYRVSNYGRVYDILNHRFMKLSLCGKPQYHYVTLSHKFVRKTFRVHRLVALSFIGNPNGLPIVDHINRDRFNNFTGNLRWVTRSENQQNSDRIDNAVVKQLISVLKTYQNNKLKIIKNINRNNRLNLIKDKIKYRWKHEYVTKTSLCEQYQISFDDVSRIVDNVSKKQRKPVFQNVDVGRIYLRQKIREIYLGGERSRKKIAKDLGTTIKIVDTDLYGLPNHRRPTLSLEKRQEIYEHYINGKRFMDCVREFGITKSMMVNLINKFQ